MDKLKLTKIAGRFVGLAYYVDQLEEDKGILTIRGWIFSKKSKLTNVSFLIVDSKKHKYKLQGQYYIRRVGVYQAYKCLYPDSERSGFLAKARIDNIEAYTVYICFKQGNKEHKVYLGDIKNEIKLSSDKGSQVTEINTEDGFPMDDMLKEQENYSFSFPDKYKNEYVDIIVPVYNGLHFFDKLFSSMEKTSLNYRLIIIDDASPDERVLPYLENYAKCNKKVILIKNEKNLGFVQSVNKGLAICENHVAIVNTDVELPNLWLERLMLPIFEDETVASTTPFTNCGTLVSFPNFGKDNSLFLGLNVQEIDNAFIKMPPKYVEMPTGVGFCMGMNKSALDKIGYLDAESFGKGYGEENDWCQRAIENGFKNVQVENLFVYHNHGGSFLSEDKIRYLKEHEEILLKKHSNYNRDVAKFFSQDPNLFVREYLKQDIIVNQVQEDCILAFDHSLGGGAYSYLLKQKDYFINEGKKFVIVKFDLAKEFYTFTLFYKDYEIHSHVNKTEGLFSAISYFHVDQIWINELVTYQNLFGMLNHIKEFALDHQIYLKMLIHDFYTVCPTINLLNYEDKYCYVPDCKKCDKCLAQISSLQKDDYVSMEEWRKNWASFLKDCNEVVTFSEDSKNIVEKAYGHLNNIVVKPHQIEFIPRIEKKFKTTNTLNIGLLGSLTKHKGRLIVEQYAQIIEKNHLNYRLVLIGSSPEKMKVNKEIYHQTGSYTRDSIARLALENDIDIFLIPSIWPETFSYTTEEIIKIGFPVMCFDLGAPAERIRRYEKGIIIPEISSSAVIETCQKNEMIQSLMQFPKINKRVLFVVEEITFSSRYRVDHLREQLLLKGISSDCVPIAQLNKVDLKEYTSIVIYRASEKDEISKLVNDAHKNELIVYYDIDDYIFNYQKIKELKFLQGEDYTDFENYSRNIRETMQLCDAYITSTENLKLAIKEDFPGKEVYVNRNVASLEMLTLSECVLKTNSDKIVIGYFSGTKTHNEDFESIKNILLEIMRKDKRVNLLIGGQIELPNEFSAFNKQIERFDFVSWKKLPELIARCDINLMPLENTFFHACKSENKWMEAALVKVPTIASWNSELANTITDGKTGFLCENKEQWKEKLNQLIEKEELRNRMAESAYQRVLERYTTYYIEEDVFELFK